MTLLDIALLSGAGLVAGAINALAGGGTIFTFSALMAIGLPAITANVTSAVSVLPGQLASTFAYRNEIRTSWPRLLKLILVSAIGGLIGGGLLLVSDEGAFRTFVPWLILLATTLFAFAPKIATLGEQLALRNAKVSQGAAIGTQGFVAIYGGYFGAGMGIMMLASLALSEGRDFHKLNAAKNLLACVMQGTAVILFLASGVVRLDAAIVVAIASVIGGWSSVIVGRMISQTLIRWLVIGTGVGLTTWYFLV